MYTSSYFIYFIFHILHILYTSYTLDNLDSQIFSSWQPWPHPRFTFTFIIPYKLYISLVYFIIFHIFHISYTSYTLDYMDSLIFSSWQPWPIKTIKILYITCILNHISYTLMYNICNLKHKLAIVTLLFHFYSFFSSCAAAPCCLPPSLIGRLIRRYLLRPREDKIAIYKRKNDHFYSILNIILKILTSNPRLCKVCWCTGLMSS